MLVLYSDATLAESIVGGRNGRRVLPRCTKIVTIVAPVVGPEPVRSIMTNIMASKFQRGTP